MKNQKINIKYIKGSSFWNCFREPIDNIGKKFWDIKPIRQRKTLVKIMGSPIGYIEERPRLVNLKDMEIY